MLIGVDGNEANEKEKVGVHQYAFELLKAIWKIDHKNEWLIYLKNPPGKALPPERKGWKYEVIPGRSLWVIKSLTPKLWTTAHKPSIFFTPSHYIPPVAPMPVVCSIMDLNFIEYSEQFTKYDYWQLKYWSAWSLLRSKKVIAISESTRNDILKHFPFTRGKVEVTLLGYDKARFNSNIQKPEVEKIKRHFGITSEYLLFLGTLKPSKNIERLLDAFSLLLESGDLKKGKKVKLVIAGKKGWLFDSIFRKVNDLDIASEVIFTDFVPEDLKPALIKGAKALVSPSLWEGFGLHVVEAMACGVPVVVSNAGSLPEIVGSVGLVVDPLDTNGLAKEMLRIIELPVNEYGDLSKRVASQAQSFSWEKTARETVAILEAAHK